MSSTWLWSGGGGGCFPSNLCWDLDSMLIRRVLTQSVSLPMWPNKADPTATWLPEGGTSIAPRNSTGLSLVCRERGLQRATCIKMPTKGKYFFSENEDCKITDPLYEKYRYASQQHPLLLFLLFIVVLYCATLVVVFACKEVSIYCCPCFWNTQVWAYLNMDLNMLKPVAGEAP